MSKYKILVVDDEESLCEILKFNLEKEGYEVTTVYSAEEVLSMDITAMHLIILDIIAVKSEVAVTSCHSIR